MVLLEAGWAPSRCNFAAFRRVTSGCTALKNPTELQQQPWPKGTDHARRCPLGEGSAKHPPAETPALNPPAGQSRGSQSPLATRGRGRSRCCLPGRALRRMAGPWGEPRGRGLPPALPLPARLLPAPPAAIVGGTRLLPTGRQQHQQ